MLVTLLGMVMLVRPVQSQKAQSPMLVTPLGMVMLTRPVQPEKASTPMFVTPLGIVYTVSALPSGYRINWVFFC